MNLEGLTLHILTKKLQNELLGSKISKIFMPSRESLLIIVKRERDTTALFANFSGNSPLLYLPDVLPERPDTPPTFCMLLRKHLEEGRITKIEQSDLDRVITLDIDTIGNAKQIITKKLIFELTGKNANIIFTQDDIIFDSLKHVNRSMSSFRQIMPNIPYIAPPAQTGLSILSADPEIITAELATQNAPTAISSLIKATSGIGKVTAQELFEAANIPFHETLLNEIQVKDLTKAIQNLQNNLKTQDLLTLPVYAVISRTNQVKTILPVEPHSLDDSSTILRFSSLNQALNYATTLTPIQIPEQEHLQKLVTNEIQRLEKKLPILQNDLEIAENAELQRIIADTIMANIYQLHKGQSTCTLENIYDGTNLEINLSALLSPTENAQAYYKRYNKFKRAQNEVLYQINTTKETLEYLASIESSLIIATTKSELAEIKQEIISAGLMPTPNKKSFQQASKSSPLVVELSDETKLYIGKNNKQNDYVTFNIGRGNDLWFHTKNIPGSHVILKTALPQADEKDIAIAAMFAAYYSKARASSKVPVDYTERRYVKKPSGAKPGFVIYTDQKTHFTTPSEEELKTLLPK